MPTPHRFSIRAQLCYQLSVDGWLLLNMAAAKNASQRVIRESIRNNHGIPFREHIVPDVKTRFHGIAAPAGDLEIIYEAEVERDLDRATGPRTISETALIDLPPEVVRFLYPSRYCESDKLVRLAGVCRDFAHLGVAFSRALGIPARYGSAYAYGLPQPDFHAFFEVWLGGRWWYYDATRMAPQHGFVWVGSGHDAADTSVATMSSSVQFESLEIRVDKLSAGKVKYANGPVGF